MRASKYNIIIDTKKDDKFLLVHGYTGAIDVVQRKVIEYLKDIRGMKNKISDETISILKKRGYLTEKDVEEENTYLKSMAEMLQKNSIKKNPKSFYFIPTYDCNFRCPYCYESTISDNGNGWTQEKMTEEMVDHAYNAMDEFAKTSKVSDTIHFYGGEPFLNKNADIVKYILDKGLNKNLGFGAITNGYELNAFEEYLGEKKIKTLQITLDGPPKHHNLSRFLHDGSPTFDKISKNISLALSKGTKVNVRTNVDRNNFDELIELVEIFKKNGWQVKKNFSAYIAFKRAYGLENDCTAFTGEGELLKEWFKLLEQFPNIKLGTVDMGIKKTFNESISNDKIMRFKASYCGANSSMYLFDPLGDIYTCWDVVKEKRCKVGEYFPEFYLNQEYLNNWHSRHVGNIEQCSKCKYALYCGGGCEGQLFHDKEKFFNSYCNDFPVLFKDYVLYAYNRNSDVQSKIAQQLK